MIFIQRIALLTLPTTCSKTVTAKIETHNIDFVVCLWHGDRHGLIPDWFESFVGHIGFVFLFVVDPYHAERIAKTFDRRKKSYWNSIIWTQIESEHRQYMSNHDSCLYIPIHWTSRTSVAGTAGTKRGKTHRWFSLVNRWRNTFLTNYNFSMTRSHNTLKFLHERSPVECWFLFFSWK